MQAMITMEAFSFIARREFGYRRWRRQGKRPFLLWIKNTFVELRKLYDAVLLWSIFLWRLGQLVIFRS